MLHFIDRRKLYYDLIGRESDPVVFMAHSLSAEGGMWAEQVPALLAAGFRVLRADMRGHGGSAWVSGDYTFGDLAEDVVALMTALELAPVHFVGLSIGGMIGQELAIRHARRFRSFVLCDTLPASNAAAKGTWDERRSLIQRARTLEPMADATLDRWFSPGFRERESLRSQQIRNGIVATSVEGYLGCSAALMSFDFTGDLGQVRVPTLVVCGSDDEGTPPAENRRIAELIPDARYVEIPGARHLPNVEFADQFNESLLGFLQAQG